MKKLLALGALSIGLFHFAEAQTFTWGYPATLDHEADRTISHVMGGDHIYRVSSHYDIDIFNYRITADAFTADGLEKKESVNLGIEQPAMGSALSKHLGMHPRKGTDFVFFSTETDRNTTENNLYWQSGDIGTGQKSERKLIAAIVGKNNSNNGQYLTAGSENGEFFAVLLEQAFYKKTPEKIEIHLYDKALNQVATIAHEFEFDADRVPKHMLSVDNAGNVYLVKRFDLPKQKPYHSVFTWKRNSTALTEQSLRQDDNFQLAQIYPHFHKGNFYLTAVITDAGSSTFGMKIDMDGRNSGTSGWGLLCVAFSPEAEMLYAKRNDFKVVTNLSIKQVLSDGDKHWVVMQRMASDKKSSSNDPLAKNVTYTYSYLSNGFMLGLVNAGDGSLVWSKTIDTSEPDTRNDNGAYLSLLPMLHQGNLAMLYNETQTLPDPNGGTYNKRVPIMEVTSPTGEVVTRGPLMEAGVGVKKKEMFDLDTGHIVPVGDGKFLVRAKQGSTAVFKYGYLQL